jgi:hypothetical protein
VKVFSVFHFPELPGLPSSRTAHHEAKLRAGGDRALAELLLTGPHAHRLDGLSSSSIDAQQDLHPRRPKARIQGLNGVAEGYAPPPSILLKKSNTSINFLDGKVLLRSDEINCASPSHRRIAFELESTSSQPHLTSR